MTEQNGDVVELIMTNVIDQQYFDWLTSQIELPENNPNTYHDLFERMHNTEFIWTVPNDDNRVQDGLDLRTEFRNSLPRKKRSLVVEHMFRGATALEVLIGLSRRVAFTAGGEAPLWAWQLLENIKLDRMADPLADGKVDKVDEILEMVIWRTYERDGEGGFFPLNYADEDQTTVELWYQMNAYVGEIKK